MNLDRYSDNFFEVNHLNGFLPKKSPLAVLPERYSELQVLIDEMPIKKANGQGGLLSTEGAIEDAVKNLTAEYIAKWINSDVEKDQDLREAIYQAIKIIPEVERHLRIIVEEGKIAKTQFNRIRSFK